MEAASPRIRRRPERMSHHSFSGTQLPESPRGPMEFLSRSWSASALQVSNAVASQHHHSLTNITPTPKSTSSSSCTTTSIPEEVNAETDELDKTTAVSNQFSFTSSATSTSQLVLERILSQSEVSPLTPGRLSHSSEPLVNDNNSPPVSPSEEFDDVVKYFRTHNSIQPLFNGGGRASAGNGSNTPNGGKSVGRWLKERKEKKKEETRAHNAQIHAAISVAAVASAIAAIAAASSSTSGKNEQSTKTDMAVASALTLVAAQCVEAAEAMGAESDHLASVVSSAVNVRSPDDIVTLTAAAATALRGATTLKARALKEVRNVTAVLPAEKGISFAKSNNGHSNGNYSGELDPGEDFLSACNQELIAKGGELLKRTRKGDLHWKVVSVYVDKAGQVILKMKSKHIAGTFTKRTRVSSLYMVCKDMPAWPGRHLFDDGEQRLYFGLKTETRGVVEFECRSQKEYHLWTRGVSRLLSIAAERKPRRQSLTPWPLGGKNLE
ncbi:Forked1 isoform 2 [Hibiscus syriacus]|uniref:Forked1 isoform 2 n=1 Tax=Hibiscus syriacus TaxID=106335 RepID=A0A6A2Z0Q3_HIBSY|nr:Forked1 isoform 2 [Hibiscus syriacus]